MPFIGNQPALSYTSFAKQDFTTSATTSYTLDNPVANANELALFINFVRQEPTTAYSASGTSLTLTSATSASDDMYCVYLGKAVQTVNPPNASVGISQLTATGTKDATTFLRGDNTFASAGGGDNTPAFAVYQSSSITLNNSIETKLTWNTELFDTNNAFSSNTFTCPSGGAGKYKFTVSARIAVSADSLNWLYLVFKKNGNYVHSGTVPFFSFANNPIHTFTPSQTNIITLAENDYVEAFILVNLNISSGTLNATANEFSGYKLIGV